MDNRRAAQHDDRAEVPDARRSRASRYLALDRQREELRRERDAILIGLAEERGVRGLAEDLQIAPELAAKLLEGARERARGRRPDESASGTRATDVERRAALDSYYEALGNGPPSMLPRGPHGRARRL